MIITYLGKECIRLQTGDTVIAINPPDKKSDFKVSGFGSDICLISLPHEDFNGSDTAAYGEKKPFVISGPGEYETMEILIEGYPIHASLDGEDAIGTAYAFTFDGMKICHLGPIAQPELSQEMKEALDGNVDICFVPIGGKTVITPEQAYKLAKHLGSKVIIPIDYGKDQTKESLQQFLKVSSAKNKDAVDKLTVKLKDILNKESEVTILQES